MTNVMVMTGRAVMKRLARWLCIGALAACITARLAVLFTRRVCSAWWPSVGALPPVRQQLPDPAVQLRGQPREHVLQVGPGLVPIELGRLQQAHHHRGSLARLPLLGKLYLYSLLSG